MRSLPKFNWLVLLDPNSCQNGATVNSLSGLIQPYAFNLFADFTAKSPNSLCAIFYMLPFF